jgi:hypothetical protein
LTSAQPASSLLRIAPHLKATILPIDTLLRFFSSAQMAHQKDKIQWDLLFSNFTGSKAQTAAKEIVHSQKFVIAWKKTKLWS